MKSERRHFAHIVVVIQLVETLLVQSNVDLAIFARALSIDADLLSTILTVGAAHSLTILKGMESLERRHVHGFVVLLQVCVLDAQNLQLRLRLGLLLAERFLNIGHHLHGVSHLARQVLILALHVAQTFDLLSEHLRGVLLRFVFQHVLSDFVRADCGACNGAVPLRRDEIAVSAGLDRRFEHLRVERFTLADLHVEIDAAALCACPMGHGIILKRSICHLGHRPDLECFVIVRRHAVWLLHGKHLIRLPRRCTGELLVIKVDHFYFLWVSRFHSLSVVAALADGFSAELAFGR